MMRAPSRTAGAAAPRPRLRHLRRLGRLTAHAVMLACWLLVLVMAAVTWGPHVTPYRTDIIVGRSMEPTIPLHSVIVVKPVDAESIRRGDVITYQQPDQQDRKVTHRVVRLERTETGEPAFVTRGDANDVRDPYRVTYAGTGYRVVTHVPHVGRLLLHAQTRLARVLLVVLPVLVLLAQFLRWVWRGDQHEGRIDRCGPPGGSAEATEAKAA